MDALTTRNIGLDLIRVTEATALSAARWSGLGMRDGAHHAATQAMVRALSQADISGRIVIGEESRLGEFSPLSTSKRVGTGNGPPLDVVVDPIDGTNLVVKGHPGAISLVAVAPAGAMWSPDPAAIYMDKIVVDRDAAEVLVQECMDAPAAWTLALLARVKKVPVRDLTVIVLDRPRHRDLIEEIRAAGARVVLRSEGDAEGALEAALPNAEADMLMGIGGVSEGVIAACAVKALGGAMLGRLAPQSEEEKEAILAAGLDINRVLTSDELVASNEVYFAATGITSGPLLSGVRFLGRRAETHSLLLRAETGTRRFIQAEHLVAD
ncbi:MAG: fructose-bisphosphatase class II family protein [Chloroflexi bacterium]|nr:fructose-bisphosphatase class II family protein [Chloroflexota bacterium]MCI0577582.1 fructose-bisphosphatase class II family protein [Chloroflexota bacterium]MCI0644198.1 fructose-bisphosphatase class II family protein [Chloroflexota bacterium]MCI0725219.1 fructose-bisphosphatase class II family protein [Chloroflexota bacterium]